MKKYSLKYKKCMQYIKSNCTLFFFEEEEITSWQLCAWFTI